MKALPLLPGWPEEIARSELARKDAARRALLPLKVDLVAASAEIRRVGTEEEARDSLRTLQSISVSAIAVDSEFTFTRPDLELRSGGRWNDIRSQKPICVSLAAWVAGDQDAERYVLRAVLDVRVPQVVPVLEEILRLRVPLVFHHLKAEAFTLWSMGLDPDLQHVYDTSLVAACLHLGHHHRRSLDLKDEEGALEIQAKADLARSKAHHLSLEGQCEHYRLAYPFSGSKDEMRRTFLDYPPGERLTERMLAYAAADAEWTLRLYVAQQPDVLQEGLAHHLYTVEFPFALANARMEWRGVHVDPFSLEKLGEATRKAAEHYAAELRGHGIDPPGSRKKFLQVMARAGVLDQFQRDGEPSTRQELLEELEGLHPAIRSFRLHRRYRRLAGEEWIRGALTGADGRTHPSHKQLGADTGRNSCSAPNIAGIGKILRPVVTAPPGRALVELDYSQIEVAVAAAEHDDPDLIQAFNSGDVYAAMAQRFYAERLSAEERQLMPEAFKKRRGDLRGAMKTFVLAVLYNIQAQGIAARFGITLKEAERERIRFLDMYPVVKRRLEESSVYGSARGYCAVVSGLRRRTGHDGKPSFWTKNFLRNTPIQGSAAVVFKLALIRLDQAIRGTDTWLVLPVHDAVLIECALADLDKIAAEAASIMEAAVHAIYPKLKPKVEVNKSHPHCWKKDGHADSLEQFLADPTFRIDIPHGQGHPELILVEGVQGG